VAWFSRLLDNLRPWAPGEPWTSEPSAGPSQQKGSTTMSAPTHPTQPQPTQPTQQPPEWQPPPPEWGAINPTPQPVPWGAGIVQAPIITPPRQAATPHDAAVERLLADGWQIQSATPYGTYMAKPLNHLLHFLIGLFTLGLWWWVWLVLAFMPRRHYVPANLLEARR
jgi:hypothetical protein